MLKAEVVPGMVVRVSTEGAYLRRRSTVGVQLWVSGATTLKGSKPVKSASMARRLEVAASRAST